MLTPTIFRNEIVLMHLNCLLYAYAIKIHYEGKSTDPKISDN